MPQARYLEGNGGSNTLYGGADNDILKGDQDAARLTTAQVADQANWGEDYLDGEGGDDLIWGNGGADTLYGGAGNDQLVGDETDGELAIAAHGEDYLDGEDALQLRAVQVLLFTSPTCSWDGRRRGCGARSTGQRRGAMRRVIEYLLSPVQRAGSESLRER